MDSIGSCSLDVDAESSDISGINIEKSEKEKKNNKKTNQSILKVNKHNIETK